MATTPEPESEPRLVEGEDFYREGPYVVFTEAFLLRRHCPWGYGEAANDVRREGSC